MPNLSIAHAISEINGEKVFATKLTTGAAEVTVDLATIQMPVSPVGDKVCDPTSGINQPMLMIQCDQDFYYCFGSATVTLPAGANPGIFVKGGDQEFVRPASGPGRTVLRTLQSTATGTLRVYVLRAAVRS